MWACFMLERERERERDKEGDNEELACKGAYTLFTGHREKEREREREYLFLKGMTGALAPFSYLVIKIFLKKMKVENSAHKHERD